MQGPERHLRPLTATCRGVAEALASRQGCRASLGRIPAVVGSRSFAQPEAIRFRPELIHWGQGGVLSVRYVFNNTFPFSSA